MIKEDNDISVDHGTWVIFMFIIRKKSTITTTVKEMLKLKWVSEDSTRQPLNKYDPTIAMRQLIYGPRLDANSNRRGEMTMRTFTNQFAF